MSAPKIGKASYGYVKKNFFKLKDGSSAYRILPPLGDLADEGRWSVFWNVHYGYKNTKGQLRAFQSPLVKNRKTKMIEAPDAALERIEVLKAQYEEAKKTGNTVLEGKLAELVGQKGRFNLDSNHYMNVIDTQGNVGILKIRHRAKLALDATIKALREKGVDPLSVDDGRFFVFRRSGMGLDTTFQVEVLTKSLQVAGVGEVQQQVVHKLTDDIIARLGKEAAQLDKLFKRPTSEETAQIVKECDIKTGISPAVDRILDAKEEADTVASDDGDDYEEPTTQTAAPTTASQTPVAQQAAAAMQAPAAQAPAPQAAPQTSAPAAQTTNAAPQGNLEVNLGSAPKTTAQVIADQSQADFLKSLGIEL